MFLMYLFSVYLLYKSMDWFLYDRTLCHKGVKTFYKLSTVPCRKLNLEIFFISEWEHWISPKHCIFWWMQYCVEAVKTKFPVYIIICIVHIIYYIYIYILYINKHPYMHALSCKVNHCKITH